MNNSQWLKVFFIISFLFIGAIGLFNYIIDPLWSFDHSNRFNSVQDDFNERQQKTNYIYNKKLDNFNGILLGSSRSTFINQNEFKNMNIYNYSLNSMFPYEYREYINFAKSIKGNEFNYIIIGVDFFGTNSLKKAKFKDPNFYINKSNSFFYRYKMLFSLDATKKSLKNIRNLDNKKSSYYDRNNIKYQPNILEDERYKRYSKNLKRHTLDLSNPNYIYNNNYIKILRQLKKENPNTKFIIFTSAVTSDLLVSILKNAKRINDYERWLKELIEVYGEVNHFMAINSITNNLNNYPDDDHAYPHIVKFIANKISGYENKNIPSDFGINLDKNNIDGYLKELRIKIKKYKI